MPIPLGWRVATREVSLFLVSDNEIAGSYGLLGVLCALSINSQKKAASVGEARACDMGRLFYVKSRGFPCVRESF